MVQRRTLVRSLLLLTAVVLTLLSTAVPALACTAVYVGSEVSEDGSILLARSNDYQQMWANHMEIVERVENEPGRKMPVDLSQSVFAPIPETTYRYTSTPWMDSAQKSSGWGKDATACTNECGVAMSMSVTGSTNKKALEADPLVKGGLTEFNAVDLVVCQSSTARDAIDVLCKIVDEYGSSEYNIALVADQKEAWYMEIYTGHQYAAVRLPSNKVAAFGNEFNLQYLSEYEEYKTSSGLLSLPEERGFAVKGENGELDLFQTYAGSDIVIDYNHMRTWKGHQILAPQAYEEYHKDERYPLCFDPQDHVSVQDVMELLRNRYEGSEYSPDETGRTDMRVIGTETSMSVHVLQVYPNLRPEMSCVTWECVGPATYGVFVPLSNACTALSEAYDRNQPESEKGVFDAQTYPFYTSKELNTLCSGEEVYEAYGMPVREYWQKVEDKMRRGMESALQDAANKDGSAAAAVLTDYCAHVQEQAFDDARQLLNDVKWYMSLNSNSMRNVRDSTTGEVTDEKRQTEPIKVTLDTLHKYEWGSDDTHSPSKSPSGFEEKSVGKVAGEAPSSNPILIAVIIGLVVAVIVVSVLLVRATMRQRGR